MHLDVLLDEYSNELLAEPALAAKKKQLKKRRTLTSIPSFLLQANEEVATTIAVPTRIKTDLYKKLINIIENDDMDNCEERVKRDIRYKELKGIRKQYRSIVYSVGAKRPEPYFLEAIMMNDLERVFIDYDLYPDKKPLLSLRKNVVLTWRHFQNIAQKLVTNSLFDLIVLILILLKCFLFVIRKSQAYTNIEQYNTHNIDIMFLVFYLVEMVLKIVGLGVIAKKTAFFRNGWNIFDLFIIFLMLLNVGFDVNISDYSLLRTFKLLRPIKTLSQLKKLQIMLEALFSAAPLLFDTLLLLIFFYLLYAIAGVQLFSGILKRRCFNSSTGRVYNQDFLCGNIQCPEGYICGKMLENPEDEVMSFDSVASSFLQVYLIVTLDGWTSTMYKVQKTLTNYSWVYFVSVVVFGAFILLNLTQAVIKVKFTETHNKLINKEKKTGKKRIEEDLETYDLYKLKKEGLWRRDLAFENLNFMEVPDKSSDDNKSENKSSSQSQTNINTNVGVHAMLNADSSNNPSVNPNSEKSPNDRGSISNSIEAPSNISPSKADSVSVSRNGSSVYHQPIINTRLHPILSPGLKNKNSVTAKDVVKENSVMSPTSPKRVRMLVDPVSERPHRFSSPLIDIGKRFTDRKSFILSEFKKIKPRGAKDRSYTVCITDEVWRDKPKDTKRMSVVSSKNLQKIQKFRGAPDSESGSEIDESELKSKRRIRVGTARFSLNSMKKSILQFLYSWEREKNSRKKIKAKYLTIRVRNDMNYHNKNFDDIFPSRKEDEEKKAKLEKENHFRKIKLPIFYTLRKKEEKNNHTFSSIKAFISFLGDFKFLSKKKHFPSFLKDIFSNFSFSKIRTSFKIKSGESELANNYVLKNISYLEKLQNTLSGIIKKLNIPFLNFFTNFGKKNKSGKKSIALMNSSRILSFNSKKYQSIYSPRFKKSEQELSASNTGKLHKGSFVINLKEPEKDDSFPEDSLKANMNSETVCNQLINDTTVTNEEENQKNADRTDNRRFDTLEQIKEEPVSHESESSFKELSKKELMMSSFLKSPKISQPEPYRHSLSPEISVFQNLSNFKKPKLRSSLRNPMVSNYLDPDNSLSKKNSQFKRVSINTENAINEDQSVNKSIEAMEIMSPKSFKEMKRIKSFRSSRSSRADPVFEYKELKVGFLRDKEEDAFEEIKSAETEKTAFNLETVYFDIKEKDAKKGVIFSYNWSAEDVLPDYRLIGFYKSNLLIDYMNKKHIDIWLVGLHGTIKMARSIIRMILQTKFFEILISVLILVLTFFLSLEGLVSDRIFRDFNIIFTIIFFFETFLKMFAYGYKRFFDNKLNALDFFLLITSITESILFISQETKYVRFFTSVKVLRILKLLLKLNYIQFLFRVLSKTVDSFFYLALLLILFIFLYSLLGMELFGGKFDKLDEDYETFNFDTFLVACTSSFNVVTLDNVIKILKLGFKSEAGPLASSVFVVSLIFIGNFVLLNLFLAILLDAFTQNLDKAYVQDQELMDDEYKEFLEDEKQKQIEHTEYMEQVYKMRRVYLENKDAISKSTFGNNSKSGRSFMDEMESPTRSSQISSKNNIFESRGTSSFVDFNNINNIGIPQMFLNNRITTEMSEETPKRGTPVHRKDDAYLNSLLIFSRSNKIRVFCEKLINSKIFNKIMAYCIILSIFGLVLDTYTEPDSQDQYDQAWINVALTLNSIITSCFIIETISKIISMGFIRNRDSYMRYVWNIVELLITITSIVDIVLERNRRYNYDLQQALRLIRLLRVTRLISLNNHVRIVLESLFGSLSGLLNVGFVIAIVWLVFGIFGIILFGGRFGYCENPRNFNKGKAQCQKEGLSWDTYDNNFDNIFNSMLTLFVLSTFDGWYETMNIAVNSHNETEGPLKFNNQYSAYIFFIGFLIFGTMFLSNLFVGVIFYNFLLTQKSSKHQYLTDTQLCWVHLQKLILVAEPNFKYTKPPSSQFRRMVHFFIYDRRMERVFLTMIILSIIPLALYMDGGGEAYQTGITIANHAFSLIFLIEFILKCAGLGLKGYFYNLWNKLDFIILCLSLLDLLFELNTFGFVTDIIDLGPKLVKASRVMRLTRLLQVVKKLENVQKLVRTLLFSLPMTLNVLAVLSLVFFIYALFGCQFFDELVIGNDLDSYVNFNNFSYAVMTLFKVSTADEWGSIMYGIRRYHSLGPLYFVSFYTITTFILTNLFFLILLRQFEEYYFNPGNPLHSFKENLEEFRRVWSTLTEKYRGIKLHRKNLNSMFYKLKLPLGFKKTEKIEIVLKAIFEMSVKIDNRGFIYFNDLLFSLTRRIFHKIFETEGWEELAQKEVEKEEEKTKLKLEYKKKRQRGKAKFRSRDVTMVSVSKDIYNPLEPFFFFKMAFYSWKNYTNTVIGKLQVVQMGNAPGLEEYSEYSQISENEADNVKISLLNKAVNGVNGEEDNMFRRYPTQADESVVIQTKALFKYKAMNLPNFNFDDGSSLFDQK